MSTTEYKLLATLRNQQFYHFLSRIKSDLFTGDRVPLFEAMSLALRNYGNLSAEAIENYLQSDIPPQLDVHVCVDPQPLIDDLARLYRKRKLTEISVLAKERANLFDPALDDFQDMITGAAYVHEEDSSLSTGITSFLGDLAAKESGSYRWLDTGVKFLNNMFSEWYRGDLTLITGASGGGKSGIMNTSALSMARLHKETGAASPVAVFSIEMPKSQLVIRFISDITGIDSAALRMGRYVDRQFNPVEKQQIVDAVNYLNSLPLFMLDNDRMTADWIIAQTKELNRRHGVECIFIDYLQLMACDMDGGSKHYGLSSAVKQLKNYAKDANLAIVILAQIHDDGKIRDVGDADRDAGAIVRITLDKDNMDDDGICPAVFDVTKNRHGKTGKYTALFNTKNVKFL